MDLARFPAFQTYAVFAVVLCVFSLALDGAGAVYRGRSKYTLNREDSTTTSKGAKLAEEENADVARANRAWRNAFANIVPFLFVALIYVLTGVPAKAATIYFSVFAGARLIHAIVYLGGKQPWRTISFVVGQLAILGMAVHVIRWAIA